MRKTLALAVAGAAMTATLLPVQSASAVCFEIHGVPGCHNPCTTIQRALPELGLICLA